MAKLTNPSFSEIGILLYPNALLSAVYGLTDLFNVANQLAEQHAGIERPILRVSHWTSKPEQASDIRVAFDTHPGAKNNPAFLIAPPSLGAAVTHDVAVPYALWLTDRKFNRMRPSMARVLGLETRSAKEG